jgi:hypothetical protein
MCASFLPSLTSNRHLFGKMTLLVVSDIKINSMPYSFFLFYWTNFAFVSTPPELCERLRVAEVWALDLFVLKCYQKFWTKYVKSNLLSYHTLQQPCLLSALGINKPKFTYRLSYVDPEKSTCTPWKGDMVLQPYVHTWRQPLSAHLHRVEQAPLFFVWASA